jgi:CubicO group peptidase (beta-lactamase class C family)
MPQLCSLTTSSALLFAVLLFLIIMKNFMKPAFFGCLLFFICNTVVGQQNPPEVFVKGELGTKLDTQMRQVADKGFSGVLFVAKDGQIVLEKGYGLADRENKTTYSPKTVFDVGSITKQFTGAAILKLETQGKLRTQDKISKYLKDVPADKAGITLHHLLTHSAGLIDVLGDDYEKLSRDEMIKGALASKLQTAPGAKYEYSNLGYSLLGAIIEIVTGKSYERYLHDNLFKPAGMKETGYVIPKWKRERLAVGYAPDGSRWGTPLDHLWDKDGPFWNLRANGGILSTVGDLYKWHLALEGEKILSKEAKEKYFAPHIAEQPEAVSFYGYGWVNQKTPRGTTLIWHDGGNGFFYADFRRYIDEKVVYIVATNSRISSFRKEYAQVLRSIFSADASK